MRPAKEQFETPVDENGLVDIRALVMLGKTTVQEGYRWDMSMMRSDHLFWPETPFRALADRLDDDTPMTFRNLPLNRLKLPLEFERWKHAITVPPDFPDYDVMRYSVEAWSTALELYGSVKAIARWERQRRVRVQGLLAGTGKSIPREAHKDSFDEFILEKLALKNKGVAQNLERHHNLPEPFQIIKPDDSVRKVARYIGYAARHGCQDGLHGRLSRFDLPIPA